MIITASLMYPKIHAGTRDYGNGKRIDFTDTDGRYAVDCIIDEDTKDRMIAAGVPDVSMGHKMFRPTDDSMFIYRTWRPHLNKYLKDDSGNPVVLGPPDVFMYNEAKERMLAAGETNIKPFIEAYDEGENGLVGSGSVAQIKLSVTETKNGNMLVRLEAVGVTDLVPYGLTEDDGDDF